MRRHHPILLERIVFPETVISMAIEPDTNAERKKLADVLARLSRQDPTFTAKISEETGQTIISGMGELHLEILRERIQRDFGLKVRVHKPRVSYRESVRKAVEAEGVCHRQTAGESHYAKVRIRLEPFAGGEAISVVSTLKPDHLPEALLAATLEQTLRDEAQAGGLLGHPLDERADHRARCRLSDRRNDGSGPAGSGRPGRARGACSRPASCLLEPIMKLEVTTPDQFLGNIQADLNARRAMIVNSERRGHLSVLEAHAALAQMFGYSTQVRSLSQGRASVFHGTPQLRRSAGRCARSHEGISDSPPAGEMVKCTCDFLVVQGEAAHWWLEGPGRSGLIRPVLELWPAGPPQRNVPVTPPTDFMSAEPQPGSTIQPQPPPAPPAVRRGRSVCAAGLSASAARDGVQRHPASHDPDRIVDRLPDPAALFGDCAGPLRHHSRQRRDPRAGTAAGGGHSRQRARRSISASCATEIAWRSALSVFGSRPT